jgi:hypothetical protein
MKKIFILYFFLFFSLSANTQTLFDESRLNQVYITMSDDDLKTLYKDEQADNYFKVDFAYLNGTKSDTVKQVAIRLRGNTSRASAKKSFRISFNEYSQGANYQGVKKLNFNGSHNDPTMIREKLFYHCWSKFGLPERRTSFVKFYINGKYYGVYTQLEEIDKDWCERAFGNNGGNLYKCRYPADLAYLGEDQNKYKAIAHSPTERAYSLTTNELANDYSDLVALCKQLNQPVDAAFEIAIEKVLDVNFFLKALALEVMAGHWDDYAYNKNNYYLYKNNKTGKFEFVSYDADNTFGVDWVGQDWGKRNINAWQADGKEKRNLVTKLLSINKFSLRYNSYVDSIANYVMHPDTIFPYITKISNQIRPAVASDTYYPLDYGYSVQSFGDGLVKSLDGHTPYGIRPFISTRIANAKKQLFVATNELGLSPKKHFTISPNPASDFINIVQDYQGQITVRIYSLDGKMLSSETSDFNQHTTLSIVHLPKGVYECSIFDEKGFLLDSQRIVK